MNDADGNGDSDDSDDSDDIDDGASTLSSLEVDLGHGGRGIGGGSEHQDDPRRQYWTDRRREASNNTTSTTTNRIYSSTNALCGTEVGGDVDCDGAADATATNPDDAYHHQYDDAHVDDDEPSYMSYSLSTSSPCKSSMMNRNSSGGAGSRVGGGGAARNHSNRRPPGHFKSQSRDSSFLGGLGLLEHIGAAASSMTAADGTKSAATVYSAEGGRRSASPSHHSRDSLFRVVRQDQQSFRHAAPQAQLSTPPIHDDVDEKLLLNQQPPKRTRSHRRHFSESCLLNTSIGTDTDTTADSSHCLSHHHHIHKNNIGSSFGPPPASLLQFSGGSSDGGSLGRGSRSGAKRIHRRCASAGCGVYVAIS